MSLHLQEALRSGMTLHDLEEKYAIKSKRHPDYQNLILFKYTQTESPFAEQVVRECRGIILDESDDYKVIARAFDKFFNYGEGHAATIDWSSAIVQEKVDGSLTLVYAYDGKFHVASTGMPAADGMVQDFGFSFSKLFWDTYSQYADFLAELDPIEWQGRFCYTFELCTPFNKVVLSHKNSSLTFLGSRDLENGELPIEETWHTIITPDNVTDKPVIPMVRSFKLDSFDAAIETFQHMDPLTQEGYVIVDKFFNRVKVKHPGYVALHHAKDGMSIKAFVEIARAGEVCEVITAFPEFKGMLDEAHTRFNDLVKELEDAYDKIKHIEVQKDFAMEAIKTKCSGALFNVRTKKVPSIRRFLAEMRIDNLMIILGYKE